MCSTLPPWWYRTYAPFMISGRNVTQSEECEKDRNKQDEEHLETAHYPTWFPTIRVNPFGPTLDNDQGNRKREYAQMEEKCFASQFVHCHSEKARNENVDTRD